MYTASGTNTTTITARKHWQLMLLLVAAEDVCTRCQWWRAVLQTQSTCKKQKQYTALFSGSVCMHAVCHTKNGERAFYKGGNNQFDLWNATSPNLLWPCNFLRYCGCVPGVCTVGYGEMNAITVWMLACMCCMCIRLHVCYVLHVFATRQCR